jgi:hypothetical protein
MQLGREKENGMLLVNDEGTYCSGVVCEELGEG